MHVTQLCATYLKHKPGDLLYPWLCSALYALYCALFLRWCTRLLQCECMHSSDISRPQSHVLLHRPQPLRASAGSHGHGCNESMGHNKCVVQPQRQPVLILSTWHKNIHQPPPARKWLRTAKPTNDATQSPVLQANEFKPFFHTRVTSLPLILYGRLTMWTPDLTLQETMSLSNSLLRLQHLTVHPGHGDPQLPTIPDLKPSATLWKKTKTKTKTKNQEVKLKSGK